MDEKPPFFKSWRAIYWLLIGNLLFFILLFYGFTRHFS